MTRSAAAGGVNQNSCISVSSSQIAQHLPVVLHAYRPSRVDTLSPSNLAPHVKPRRVPHPPVTSSPAQSKSTSTAPARPSTITFCGRTSPCTSPAACSTSSALDKSCTTPLGSDARAYPATAFTLAPPGTMSMPTIVTPPRRGTQKCSLGASGGSCSASSRCARSPYGSRTLRVLRALAATPRLQARRGRAHG